MDFLAWPVWLPLFVEIVTTVLGFVSVALLARGDGRGWPVGLVMVSLSGVLYAYRNIQGQAMLQLYFLVAQLVGWRRWRQAPQQDLRGRARRLSAPQRLAVVLFWLLSSWLTVHLLEANHSDYVELDALATVGSLIAQALIVAGFAENWLLYLAVDIVLVGLSLQAGMGFYAVMYAGYCVLAWYGWCEWTRDLRLKSETSPSETDQHL